MRRYSDIQIKTFFNIFIVSTFGGKLNILHHYFLYIFPVKQQAELIYLFCIIPFHEHVIIDKILEYFAMKDIDGLELYLNSCKGSIDVEDEQDLHFKVANYLADEDRYRSCSKIFDLE